MKFPFWGGGAHGEIKWISLLYRNPGNAAACAFVVITQQQQDGFPSPRNIWACALLQTSRKEQRLPPCFPAPGCLISRGGGDWYFAESWCREHVRNEKATLLIAPIISMLSLYKERRRPSDRRSSQTSEEIFSWWRSRRVLSKLPRSFWLSAPTAALEMKLTNCTNCLFSEIHIQIQKTQVLDRYLYKLWPARANSLHQQSIINN